MNIPPLPAHYYQPGKTTWSAKPYCTNAISAPDKEGNRTPLDVDATDETALTNYGSFFTFVWAGSGAVRAWLCRLGLDTALWYQEGNAASVRKALVRAVEAQTAIEKAYGRVVLPAPPTETWRRQK